MLQGDVQLGDSFAAAPDQEPPAVGQREKDGTDTRRRHAPIRKPSGEYRLVRVAVRRQGAGKTEDVADLGGTVAAEHRGEGQAVEIAAEAECHVAGDVRHRLARDGGGLVVQEGVTPLDLEGGRLPEHEGEEEESRRDEARRTERRGTESRGPEDLRRTDGR